MFSCGCCFTREARLIAMVRLAIALTALLSLVLADDCPNQKIYVANGPNGAVFCLRNGKFSCVADDGDLRVDRTGMRVVEVLPRTLSQMLNNCRSSRTVTRDKRDIGWYYTSTWQGTSWCGEGRQAQDMASVYELDTDKCCRQHKKGCGRDLEVVPPMTCLSNSVCVYSVVTRHHCTCDEEFRKCLKNVIENASDADKDPKSQTKGARDVQAATGVGIVYFNELHQTCYVDKAIRKTSHTADNSEHVDKAIGYIWKPLAPFNP